MNPGISRLLPIAVLSALSLLACRSTPPAPPPNSTASTPAASSESKDPAAQLLGRALAAAGGWPAWMNHADASFISTLTIFDPRGNAASETIFLHKLLLHQGTKSRLESIGLDEELVFGLNGDDWWMLRGGQLLSDERNTAFTRFDAVSAEYWFQVPFVFAEIGAKLAYDGEEADGDRQWQKLRVDYAPEAAVPVQWVVAYINSESGLVDRVFFEVRTSFLRQKLWSGEFSDYRPVDGLRHERRREFFPVDSSGKLVGTKTAQQLVEHIRFDNDFPSDLFVRPPITEGPRTAT